jgi:hypothetical protein
MNPDCLNERNLILLHYGESPDGITVEAATAHLTNCAACRSRRDQLAADLLRIPTAGEPDPAVITRMAARVSERLDRKRRWMPLTGGATAGVIALAVAIIVWTPTGQLPAPNPPPRVVTSESPFVGPLQPVIREATLDLDFLEQLDLLEELETLRALEGV